MTPTDHLRAGFAEQRRERPARHRDIARDLGISEGELVAAHVAPLADARLRMRACRLAPRWAELVEALHTAGEVMALTRNESCVHEKVGVYREASHAGPAGAATGLVLGGAIDLRLFYPRWAHGFAVQETNDADEQWSLQFFDASGTAVHKVFAKPQTDREAWRVLVQAFAADDQQPGILVTPPEPPRAERPDAEVDVAAFHRDWASLRDTHEFFGLLKRHDLARTQALRLADPQFVQRVEVDAGSLALNAAAALGVPIMVFVGNPGVIQIHSGPVRRIVPMGPWINVLDAGFNLHLRADHVASAFIVGKPTCDGLVSSLELFDAQGESIAMFFGERKPGRPELSTWRSLLQSVARDTTPCEA